MKKLLLGFIFISLIIFGVFVSAIMSESTIPISKGWNLVSSGAVFGDLSDNGEIKTQDIKYAYIYDIEQNKYLLLWKNNDFTQEAKNRFNFNREDTPQWILQSSIWIYVEKPGNIKLFYESSPNSLNLIKGYNLLTVFPTMMGKSLNEIKGNCNIESAYLFDSQNQQWGPFTNLLDSEDFFQREAEIGQGFVVKVSSDCYLGSSDNSINPPQLPGQGGSSEELSQYSFITSNFGSLTFKGDLSLTNSPALGSSLEGRYAIYNSSAQELMVLILRYKDSGSALTGFNENIQFDASSGINGTYLNGYGNKVFQLTQKDYTDKIIDYTIIWPNGANNIVVKSATGFHGDSEDLVRQYLNKYPSSLN